MAQDVADLAEALTELGQKEAAERLQQKGVMPVKIYCNQQYLNAYNDKLKMYATVKANWLVKDSSLVLAW